jgi:hypothetical protein
MLVCSVQITAVSLGFYIVPDIHLVLLILQMEIFGSRLGLVEVGITEWHSNSRISGMWITLQPQLRKFVVAVAQNHRVVKCDQKHMLIKQYHVKIKTLPLSYYMFQSHDLPPLQIVIYEDRKSEAGVD